MDRIELRRVPAGLNQVSLTRTPVTEGGLSFPYTVASNGALTLTPEDTLEGFVNADASLLALMMVKTQGDPSVTDVDYEIGLGIPLSADDSAAPNLLQARFSLHPLLYLAGENGQSGIATLVNSEVVINATGTLATGELNLSGFERASDVAQVVADYEESDAPFNFNVVSYSNDGKLHLSLTEDGETINLKGFVSADGQTLLLRVDGVDSDQQENFYTTGILLGLRQN